MFTWLLPLLTPLRDEGPGGSNGGTDPDPEPSDPPADDPPPDDPEGDDPEGVGGDDSDLDPEALRRELERTRREAANRRVQLREREQDIENLQEQNRRILEALGITDDTDDPDDPSAEAERLRTENRRLRTQNRFDAVAREAGADSDLTWGYLLARGEIESLDPDAENFADTLRERIDAALEAKPSLRVTTTPPPGPPDLDGPDPQPDNPAEMPMDAFMKWRKNRDQE